MELISYSIENKNIFWVHLGFQVCKLSIDLDKIYTNIGKFNFYKTNRESKLFFSYIRNINYKNFSNVGSQIDESKVVCLIEAMKVFNEIKPDAGVKGQIKKVCVSDGQAVEYGTVLFLVG